MSEPILAVCVAFAAFCVWLGVRIVNRRERRAKRLAIGMACLPFLYVLSFGPACWLTAQAYVHGEAVTTSRALIVYLPLVRPLDKHPDSRYGHWICWWMTVGAPKGRAAIVPMDVSGTRSALVDPNL